MAGRWPLAPAIEVRILAPERTELGRWIGPGSSTPDGRVRFPDELRLRGRIRSGAVFLPRRLRVQVPPKVPIERRPGVRSASVRGRDPSFRSSVSWFESSRRHARSDARVVQWPGRRAFNAQQPVRFPSRVQLGRRSRSGASAACYAVGPPWVAVRLRRLPPLHDEARIDAILRLRSHRTLRASYQVPAGFIGVASPIAKLWQSAT